MADQLLPDFEEPQTPAAPVDGARLPAPVVEPSVQQSVAPPDEAMSAGDIAVDTLYKGTLGGVNKAVRGTLETVGAITPGLTSEGMKELVAPIEPPKLFLNKFQRDIVQFGMGFVGGAKLLEGVGLAQKLAPVATEIIGSGVGTGIVADSTEGRLSNLVEEYPFLSTSVTRYLAAQPGDSAAEGKFKAALEDMMTTPFALVILKGVKSLRNALTPQELGETIEAVKHLDNPADGAVDNALTIPEVKVTAPVASAWTPGQDTASRYVVMPGESLGATEAKTGLRVPELDEAGKPLDQERVAYWEKQLKENPEKVPGVVSKDGVVVDGRHRVTAANNVFGKDAAVPSQELSVSAKADEATSLWNLPQSSKGLTDEARASLSANMAEITKTGGLPDQVFDTMPELFNQARMTTSVPVKQTIHAVALEIKDDIAHLTTAQHHREVEAAADFLNERPDVMLGKLSQASQQAGDLPAILVAAKGFMQTQAVQIYRLSQKQRMGQGAPDDPATIERMANELAEVVRMVKSVQTGSARATSAGQIETGELATGLEATTSSMFRAIGDAAGNATDKDAFYKLADKLSMTEGNPKKIVSILEKAMDTHNEIFINGILSGIKTHEINVLSAAIQTMKQPLDIIVGGFLRRDPEAVAQGVALYRGLRASIFDSMEMARRSFMSEMSILDPGKGTVEGIGEHYAISAANYGMTPDTFAAAGVNFLGKVARVSSRFMKSEDEFFKQMNYRAHVYTQAERDAESLVRNSILSETKNIEWVTWKGEKVTLTEKEAWIRQKVEDSFTANKLNVDPKAPTYNLLAGGSNKEALDYAREATFTQSLATETWAGWPSFGELVQRMAAHPVMRGTVLPFVKVPTNLFRAGIDATPLAFARAQFHADVRAGGERAASAIGRMSLGTTMLIGATLAASEGQITGAAPGDKELRDRWLESGRQPYSLKYTDAEGKTHYVSFQRLDPYMGMLFGITADFYQTAHSLDPEARDQIAVSIGLALAQNLSSKSYLKAVTESLSMFRGGDASADILDRMLQMRAASYVPNWVGTLRNDDELKKVRTMMDAAMAKVPGLSASVEAKRGYFGEKRLAPDGWPWSAINPFPESVGKDDPVREELVRLGTSVAEVRFTVPQEKVGTVDMTKFRNATNQTAYDRWHELVGTVIPPGRSANFHDAVADLMKTSEYKSGTDGDAAYKLGSKAVMIRKLQEDYRDAALTQTLNEFSDEYAAGKQAVDIKAQVRKDHYNERRMKHGKDPLINLLDLNR
jgi:hypothetical protein